MAQMNYTPAQKTAVYWNGGNLLLSAAAGSGKTAALTGRIAELIKKGEDIRSMLIVTFSKAAAAEMRGRISSSLSKQVEEYAKTDERTATLISRAISTLPSAEISTIHAFLYRTLRPYFPTMGLPQDSHIGDEKIIKALKAEIMENLVNDLFDAGGEISERFTTLSDIIGQVRNTSSIDTELLEIAEALTSGGKDHRHLLAYADSLDKIGNSGDVMETSLGAEIKEVLSELFSHYKKIFDTLADEFTTLPVVAEKYGAALAGIMDWVNKGHSLLLSDSCDYDSMRAHMGNLVIPPIGTVTKKHACDTSVAFKLFRDELTEDVTSVKKNFFSSTHEECRAHAVQTAYVIRLIAEVLEAYYTAFAEKKKAMSLVDYADLENLALALLTDENGEPTSVALEIGKKYKYIFIDEYQDTNRVQDNIFRAISQNARRFMVGDIKQSIYRFRGAAPEVFSGYRHIWEVTDPIADIENLPQVEEFSPSDGKSLFMSENFRCDKPVTQLVNAVSEYMLPHGGIPYEKRDSLVYAKNDGNPLHTSPAAEICLIEPPKKATFNAEAEYVAERISQMIGKYSPHGDRIIKAKDIAIIMRSPGRNGDDFRNALENRGIAVSIRSEKPLSAFPSIMLLMCVLNMIDNPLRDIYTTGALRSPVFGFTMTELVEIKGNGDFPLYMSIMERAELGDEKCAAAVSWIEKQKTVSRGMRVDKYLEYLIDEIKLYSIEGIRENGSERDAVNRFCTLAADFEAGNAGITRSADISGFISYIEDILDSSDSPAGSSSGGGDDAVSIISIHSSKGLEYPICFVCVCSKQRNIQDETGTILYHGEMGFGMYLPDESRLTKCDTLVRRVVAQKIKQDSVNEEMRMLYVALTRAREQLIVTAKMSSADTRLLTARLQAEFSDGYRVKSVSQYIDWILESVASTERDWLKINVVSQPSPTDSAAEGAEADEITEAVGDAAAEYKSRFSFAYPHEYLAGVPSKLTVSKLNPQILDDGADGKMLGEVETETDSALTSMKKPAFMSGETVATAAEKGTATHVFMQFVNLRSLKENGAKFEIDRLIENRFITKETAELISIPQIRRFADSALLDKMLRSPMVKREFRFNALLPGENFTADEALKEKLSENKVKLTVQGVVDCVFRDPDTGKLVLVDYKTDSLTDEEWHNHRLAEEKLRRRHANQLGYYREICSEMFGENIDKAYIYSTHLGKVIEV